MINTTISSVCSGLLLLFTTTATLGSSTEIPPDLRLRGIAGGLHPWEENQSLLITASGLGKYTRFIPSEIGGPPLYESEFKIEITALERIWEAIRLYDFYHLEPENINEEVTGGVFAMLSVRANGNLYSVNVENMPLPPFEAILRVINAVTPNNNDLVYEVFSTTERSGDEP